MNQFSKICPKCNRNQSYSNKANLKRAIKEDTLCSICYSLCRKHRAEKYKSEVYSRLCPKCNITLTYISKSNRDIANRINSCCHCCAGLNMPNCVKQRISKALMGHGVSDITKEKMHNNHKGNSGKKFSIEHRKKISYSLMGKKKSKETIEKWKKSRLGYKHTFETKRKLRLLAINRIENNKLLGNQLCPVFNPNACKIINEYGKQHGYNFQHAMNGGEFYVKELGYWVDGYDKERNTVIEYYEKRHLRNIEHDEERQKEITNFLKCNFVVIKE